MIIIVCLLACLLSLFFSRLYFPKQKIKAMKHSQARYGEVAEHLLILPFLSANQFLLLNSMIQALGFFGRRRRYPIIVLLLAYRVDLSLTYLLASTILSIPFNLSNYVAKITVQCSAVQFKPPEKKPAHHQSLSKIYQPSFIPSPLFLLSSVPSIFPPSLPPSLRSFNLSSFHPFILSSFPPSQPHNLLRFAIPTQGTYLMSSSDLDLTLLQ